MESEEKEEGILMAVIKEMRENSLLYDISNKKYQLRHRGALEASAEKLKISVKLLDQKIHYIKRKFNESHKEVRKQKILKGRSGDGIDDLSESDEASSTEDCKKPWKWYKACDFLKSTMNVNKNMKDSAIKRKITNNKDSKTIKFDLKSFAYTEYKVPAKKSKCESSEEPSTSEKEKCLSLVPSSESFQLTPKVDDQNSNELPDPISQVPETASPEFVSIDANSDLYPIRLRSTSFPMTEERTKKDVAIQVGYRENQLEMLHNQSTIQISHDNSNSEGPSNFETEGSVSTDELRIFINSLIDDFVRGYTPNTLLKLIRDLSVFMHKFNKENK
ncbi:uncharacterized protein LOC129808624 [Phlebotomus papatasi]|uniref:uncharacterized protein LOC129808624 n=1 Tax=Phlebotomus papatasi TaxID=29031 RepID=UPI0024833CEF|nr:uncharacterized protein LOC129808624 [Phlebotomus papatasi]